MNFGIHCQKFTWNMNPELTWKALVPIPTLFEEISSSIRIVSGI